MRWRYCLLIVGSAFALMGGNCSESGVIACVEDADCADTCASECERRGEELLAAVCGDNRACQCTCTTSGMGGAGGGAGAAGGSGAGGSGAGGTGGSS
ncbi:MAG: hypothetical protein ACERNK_12500 [Deltaproteobacteria bacterium]